MAARRPGGRQPLPPAARMHILERRWRPAPGELPADRRSYVQLVELGGPLRDPTGPTPAERVRAMLEARAVELEAGDERPAD